MLSLTPIKLMRVLLTTLFLSLTHAVTNYVRYSVNYKHHKRYTGCCCLKKNQNAPRPSDVVSHIQRIGCQPEKTTLHGGQPRSWSAEQRKGNKIKSLAAYLPPTPHTARPDKK